MRARLGTRRRRKKGALVGLLAVVAASAGLIIGLHLAGVPVLPESGERGRGTPTLESPEAAPATPRPTQEPAASEPTPTPTPSWSPEQLEEAWYYADENVAETALTARWHVVPNRVRQGGILFVRSGEPGRAEWMGRTYELQAFGAGYYAYIPVAIDAAPGEYEIGDASVEVLDGEFEVQYLEVTEEQNSIRQDTERIARDQKKIDQARSQSAPNPLYPPGNEFILPVEGELTTPFGYTRYVNGAYDGSHRAIDIAAPEGTPVYATNDGTVALADNFHLTGYTVYIDHGLHAFSQYAHMSELKVATGDKVKRGDVIGLVGSTGFSTGPHMHFTFWVHNVPVDPNQFLHRTPFDWAASDAATAATP